MEKEIELLYSYRALLFLQKKIVFSTVQMTKISKQRIHDKNELQKWKLLKCPVSEGRTLYGSGCTMMVWTAVLPLKGPCSHSGHIQENGQRGVDDNIMVM